ncbi:YhcH/YjgK/YiaL family protein [Candidatus Woesearchaeota archaeon]|nr:YhcH/YjgK/YiaL family protein [Candidatus Woesearchaeota archaeon]
MIYDRLDSSLPYHGLNPHFPAAFSFLQRSDLDMLTPGKYDVENGLVTIVVDGDNLGEEKAELESHQEHIDIHYTITGVDRIGWKPVSRSTVSKHYNPANDTTFYNDHPQTGVDVAPGYFAIFFPHDAHATMAGTGRVRKIVMKVLL